MEKGFAVSAAQGNHVINWILPTAGFPAADPTPVLSLINMPGLVVWATGTLFDRKSIIPVINRSQEWEGSHSPEIPPRH